MIKKQDIQFIETSKPIRELVTKFGGQPVWFDRPQWPLSRSTNQPMQFICQIKLEREIFGDIPAKMAYLFMASDDASNETWKHDGGENAVILQPGRTNIPCQAIAEGPALFKMVSRFWSKKRIQKPCEYAVQLTSSLDTVQTQWESPEQEDQYGNSLICNKIGGVPGFLQDEEYPDEHHKKLLMQLESSTVPFWINFGDGGTGYAFLSDDGTIAKFLWQCY